MLETTHKLSGNRNDAVAQQRRFASRQGYDMNISSVKLCSQIFILVMICYLQENGAVQYDVISFSPVNT